MKKTMRLSERIFLIALVAILVIGAAVLIVIDRLSVRSDVVLTETAAEELIREAVDRIPLNVSPATKDIAEELTFRVESVHYGNEKDIIARVSYRTRDVQAVYRANKVEWFVKVWDRFVEKGYKISGTEILVLLKEDVKEAIVEAPVLTGEIDVVFYAVDGKPVIHLEDETVNTLFGGLLEVRADIAATETLTVRGEEINIAKRNSLRNGLRDCFGTSNYSSEKPDASSFLTQIWNSFSREFYRNFIEKDRWVTLLTGLGTTLAITGLALLVGLLLGFLTAVVRCTYEKSGNLPVLNRICAGYIGVIRGTPVMVQLLIIYFVILFPIGVPKFPAAVICFGLNSGAYVSEIIRGGIMAVDEGQTEAGRSLGFGFAPTMFWIVIPQAFKAVLPALCNEFISLLKETSVAFYIGVGDLTRAGISIRSVTFSNFMPLVAVALIYLVVVLILTRLVRILERRLRRSER